MLSQREFKFRVYQFSTHRMFYAGEYRLKFNRDHIFHPLLENNFQPKKKDYIVLEWTGLVDANGRDIYEGDVIRHVNFKKYGESYSRLEVVRFSDGIFTPFGSVNDDFCAHPQFMEVIGNVFENPELLEVGS